jgi:hypothetical protein
VDRQPNDHLGRSKQPLSRRFQHWQQILRDCASIDTNTYSHSVTHADANWHCNSNTHLKPDANPAVHR